MTASLSTDAATVEQVAAWLRVLCVPGYAVELRAVGVREGRYRPITVSGFFDHDHLGDMAAAALDLTRRAQAVYWTINPLMRAVLARRLNRVAEAGNDEAASDRHVARRRWLLVDCDPVMPVAGVSANDDERGAAFALARRVWADREQAGWPEPVVADSGNGCHLLYPVDLPADDGGACRRLLEALAARFDGPAARIDTKVFNPARVCKLYGTWARKGDDAPGEGRPWRASRVLLLPGEGAYRE
jgi:hypothetical protein